MNVTESLEALDLPSSVTATWLYQLAEPHRHYHTRTHIEHMLSHLPTTEAGKEMIAAIWLHDIVYDPRATDNEEKSAEQALRDLERADIDAQSVAELIRGTKRHECGSAMQNLLNDLDLGIFAASRSGYARYAERIRMEYAFVPKHIYTANRILVLERYNAMRIFRTNQFADWEPRAHANLQWEIELLRDSGAVGGVGR